jgi:hypothetical protein
MHFEILVEDSSGKELLDKIASKILHLEDTFTVISYKGIGRIPTGMKDPKDASKRILLDNIVKLLKGYGKTFSGYGRTYHAAVIIVCDLDDRCLKTFRSELYNIIHSCDPAPTARFCIAIEEGEAWLLGDLEAVRSSFPNAKRSVLNTYVNDSICGTWEKLADAIYPGGAAALGKKGWQAIGIEKLKWAREIGPVMNVEANKSASFCYFRDQLREFSRSRPDRNQ